LQLAKQLSEPKPKDIGNGDLSVYRLIDDKWKSWPTVSEAGQRYGVLILEIFNYAPSKPKVRRDDATEDAR
jgi:hypothetical protein